MRVDKHTRWFGRAFAVAALSAMGALAACGTHRAPEAKPTARAPVARGGGPISLVTAVDTIAHERCAHEGACNRIGAGRRFASGETCQAAFTHEARGQLKTTVCETGFVEPEALLDCLEAIRAGGCASDAEAACEPSSMCSP